MGKKWERKHVLPTKVRLQDWASYAKRSRWAALVGFASLTVLGGAGCWPRDDECLKGFCPHPHSKTCEIDSRSYGAGQVNPANPCLVCEPEVSVASWSPVAAGSACGTGHVCNGSGECLVSDGQACATAADCASGVCSKFYPDEDGDGQGRNVEVLLCGATTPAGYSDTYGDCCDTDAQAHSGQTAFFSVPNACGRFDYDCDFFAFPEPPVRCASCTGGIPPVCAATVNSGWCPFQQETASGTLCRRDTACEDVECGFTFPFVVSGGEGACAEIPGLGCSVVLQNAVFETRTVRCR